MISTAFLNIIIRRHMSKIVLVPQFDSKVLEDVQNDTYKPRNHPGRRETKVFKVPNKMDEYIKNIIPKIAQTSLKEDGVTMMRFLKARHLPIEKLNLNEKLHTIKNDILEKAGIADVNLTETYNEDDLNILDQRLKRKVTKLLKQRTYNWTPIDYTAHIAQVYLLTRFIPEYATLLKVLEEISKQIPQFKPHSVFDFGSGIGTAIWACHNYWSNSIGEYYCVDTSAHMTDLSNLLIQGGRENKQPEIRNVTYRQFFPASVKNKYSIVISAYSLLELPSQKERLRTIASLWEKTEDFLVIVEYGTTAGNEVVLEARDFILSINNKRQSSAHVFAPCPHNDICPKSILSNPCSFGVRYENISYSRGEKKIDSEIFSYVILRRGERRDLEDWPRIVRPVLKRSKHTVCKMCTNSGQLVQIGFTKRKHGMLEYRCVKGSRWGDLLPIKLNEEIVEDNHNTTEEENIASIDLENEEFDNLEEEKDK